MSEVRDPLYMPTMDEAVRFARSNPRTALDIIISEVAKLSPERILREACEPWRLHVGDPPEDDSPLFGVYDAGAQRAEELLAEALGVEAYPRSDGSDTWNGDLSGTLIHIVQEWRARKIYESWSYKEGYVPWVHGGNSDMQHKARDLADAEFGPFPTSSQDQGEKK